MKAIELVLLGFEPKGSENLALRVIAQAALDAGFSAAVVPIVSLEQSKDALRRAMALSPSALGLTLQDSVSAVRILPFAELARRTGFGGFIVCGGPFATLQTDWVLQHAPQVDGIVRHAGEGPVVELLASLRRGHDPGQVPGLVTRGGARLPVTAAAAQPSAWRPLRGPRPEILGIPTAEVIASMGCRERCEYCTHAAVASLAVRELEEIGVSREELLRSGLGRTIRRPLSDFADELAQLHHQDGVKYFQVIDENPIPDREDEALAWIDGLRRHLASRRVGKIALSFMTRGDTLTDTVIDALGDLGMVRTLIGIESGTAQGLRSLGRTGSAERGLSALQRLDQRGILAMFNSLMIHPDSTLDSIRAELDFLDTVGCAMFETVEAAPFAGTQLNARMAREGRLYGGTLLPMFSSSDQALEGFRVMRSRLRFEALRSYTPTYAAHDIWLSAAILARCNDNAQAAAVGAAVRDLVGEINTSRLAVLADLLREAEGGRSGSQVILEAKRIFEKQHQRLQELADRLRDLARPDSSLSRHCRNFAAAASLVFALSGTMACDAPDPKALPLEDTESNLGTHTETATQTESAWPVDTATAEDTLPCEQEQRQALESILQQGCIQPEQIEGQVQIAIAANGSVEDIQIITAEEQDTGEEPAWVTQMEDCYRELLRDESFPCLSGEDVSFWIRDWGTPV